MSIKISRKTNEITIKTANTMYVMEMRHGKFPVHLYYGRNGRGVKYEYKSPVTSFSPYFEEHGYDYFPDIAKSEFSFFGYGDFRADALRLRDMSTGCDTTMFYYKKARVLKGRVDIPGLPSADADENTETLELTMVDEVTGCELKLYYTVFADCDVISRYFTLANKGKNPVKIEKCMMLCLDIPTDNLDMLTFSGAHCCERLCSREHVAPGNRSIFSRRGASSHHYNPFFMLCDPKTTEEKGAAYGFNLVYSGSFLCEVETEQTCTTRVLSGLGSDNFSYLLLPGETFASPEAVMSYSERGLGQVSRNMHKFTRNHILPKDRFEKRPVVLNSWEAFWFDIDEDVMTRFAAEAAKVGMDMVVMDDGWFGNRIDDRRGLGDWWPNPERFKNGLGSFIENVKKSGVKFGIWIEPEMINPDSKLFAEHPEWVIKAPGRELLLSRTQAVLDMANPEVVEYLKNCFEETFGNLPIDYFKWDMNRHLSEVYSPTLPPERQGEVSFRYMKGVYELIRWFNERFPNAMIETCSGGGGRYDLGMMKYSTQIWTSDNTYPTARTLIQYGSTFGYPATTMSCHVANHGDSVEDPNQLDYGYRVALNGPLGYEFDILKVSEEAKAALRKQIAEYREYESLILRGDFYRLQDPIRDGRYTYYFVNEDNSEILLTYIQNGGDKKESLNKLKISRAELHSTYRDTIGEGVYTGEELRRGLEVKSFKEGNRAKMFHFVKE